jgi:hypothetical protein
MFSILAIVQSVLAITSIDRRSATVSVTAYGVISLTAASTALLLSIWFTINNDSVIIRPTLIERLFSFHRV